MKNNDVEKKLLRLQDNMLNFAYTLTLNVEDARDLMQETSLKVMDNEEKFVENTNFKGWVLTIMRNIFINNYRRLLRSQITTIPIEDMYQLNIPKDSGFESPDGAFTIREITKCINSFSDEYRVPFSMHIAGYKYQEIADKLNLPIGTVKSRIFFARQRLQEYLHEYQHNK